MRCSSLTVSAFDLSRKCRAQGFFFRRPFHVQNHKNKKMINIKITKKFTAVLS